jgi:hypothetical protein
LHHQAVCRFSDWPRSIDFDLAAIRTGRAARAPTSDEGARI